MISEVLVRAGEAPRMPQLDYGQCAHLKFWKDGKRTGQQQFRCSLCGKRYREGAKSLYELRIAIGRDLARGLSIRAVARRTGASRQAVRSVRALLLTRQDLPTHRGGRPRLRNCAGLV